VPVFHLLNGWLGSAIYGVHAAPSVRSMGPAGDAFVLFFLRFPGARIMIRPGGFRPESIRGKFWIGLSSPGPTG
jgi:hypothetical protein